MERRVLVSGAGSGIGRAIAERIEHDGGRVLAVDLRPDPNGAGTPFEADLATAEGNRASVDAALEHLGGLDAIVASAGFQHVAPIQDFPEERWAALLAVLLTSPFLLARYAWESLCTSGDGRFLAVEDVLLAPQAVKRILEPEEVAETAAFLLGPGGRAFTGAPVVMDLGWTARGSPPFCSH